MLGLATADFRLGYGGNFLAGYGERYPASWVPYLFGSREFTPGSVGSTLACPAGEQPLSAAITGAASLTGTWDKESNYSDLHTSGIPEGGAVLPFGAVSVKGMRGADARFEFSGGDSFGLTYDFEDSTHPDLSYGGRYSACAASSGVISNTNSLYRVNGSLRLAIDTTPVEAPYLGVLEGRLLVIPFALSASSAGDRNISFANYNSEGLPDLASYLIEYQSGFPEINSASRFELIP